VRVRFDAGSMGRDVEQRELLGGGIGAFDPARENRLPAQERTDEQVRVGQLLTRPRELP